MKSLTRILAATLTGAVLSLSATAALADGRYYDNRGWDNKHHDRYYNCLLYTSPSPRD